MVSQPKPPPAHRMHPSTTSLQAFCKVVEWSLSCTNVRSCLPARSDTRDSSVRDLLSRMRNHVDSSQPFPHV